MICRSVTLKDYRNISSASVSFSEGINVLWGKNAQGKSNVLESIYLFARGKSFRGAKDKELIRFDQASASAELSFLREGFREETTLRADFSVSGRRKMFENGLPVKTAEMIGSFRAVLFCPSHLSLISGAPALRRSFLDIALSQLYPVYVDALVRYTRFLSERNALIKTAEAGIPVSRSEWETYAQGLSVYGALLSLYRLKYAHRIRTQIAECFQDMTGAREKPGLCYRSHALAETDSIEIPTSSQEALWLREAESRLFEKLTAPLERDIHAGSTLHGPHKDDLLLTINGNDARNYASQGQQRSLALAMKLAEGDISREITGEYPVFLLDDVLSELDEDRRKYILQVLRDKQIIVTSCEPALFREIDSSTRLIRVENGCMF